MDRDRVVRVRGHLGDFQCPACRQFLPIAWRIREEYVETGKVRFIFFDFPITEVHPNALDGAQAARCAGFQGRCYWEMHDALLEGQEEWSGLDDPTDVFAGYAGHLGLDPEELRRCIEDGDALPAVQRSRDFALALRLPSTPTIVVGDVGMLGVRPYEDICALIEEAGGRGRATFTVAVATSEAPSVPAPRCRSRSRSPPSGPPLPYFTPPRAPGSGDAP